ncbi:MAG: aldo/keto reductase [Alphaproteobacteria bacterium]|nr:aldo/keto reductase [Alphaproteobacteria bacterium]
MSDTEAARIVSAAYEMGIRYFDTAPLYGHGLSERRLGRALPGLPRDSFVLSTKIGRLLVPAAEGIRSPKMRDNEPFAIRYDYSYDAVRQSFESSLERLGLERVDILLCHDIDVWTHGDQQGEVFKQAADGCLKALADMRDEGVIGAFGLGVNEWRVCMDVLELFDVDCFLLAGRFTLLEQEPLDHFLPACLDSGTSVIVGGPYNSGLLAIADRDQATYDYKPVPDGIWQKAEAIRAVCTRHGVDIRAAALQYPLRHPAVATVIPGVFSLDQLGTNIEMMQQELPVALWDDLAEENLAQKP